MHAGRMPGGTWGQEPRTPLAAWSSKLPDDRVLKYCALDLPMFPAN